MGIREQLMRDPESIPVWMERFVGDEDWCTLRELCATRVVFYPGAGFDGQPVRLFAGAYAAHVFVYADSGITRDALLAELDTPGTRFAGYQILGRRSLSARDHPQLDALFAAPGPLAPGCAPFAELVLLERRAGLGDEHGAKRFALLYVCADALAVAEALWVRGRFGAPWSVVLQDHGFGSNWSRFGEGGPLTPILARRASVLLVAENTVAWAGFEPIPNVAGDQGGQHGHLRHLYRPIRRKHYQPRRLDRRFGALLAARAAEIVCDGDRGGTWEQPDSVLEPGGSVESAMKLAGYRVYGGPGWWRRNMYAAQEVLRMVRWCVTEAPDPLVLEAAAAGAKEPTLSEFAEFERAARSRWDSLDAEGRVFMLLLASEFLLQRHEQVGATPSRQPRSALARRDDEPRKRRYA